MTERTPMTETERLLARRLARCRFLPGSFEKRFSRDLAALAEQPDAALTEKQRACLERVAHRYRKQLGDSEAWERDEAVALAEEYQRWREAEGLDGGPEPVDVAFLALGQCWCECCVEVLA